MGAERSSKALHNLAMSFELGWGNQKRLRRPKVNVNGHIAPPRCFAAVDSHPAHRRRRDIAVQRPRTGSDGERGREKSSPSELVHGSHKPWRFLPLASDGGRKSSNAEDDGILAVRKKLMLDLQTAAERMKDAVFKDGFHEGEASLHSKPSPALPAGTSISMDDETHKVKNPRTRRAACKMPVSTFVPSPTGAAAVAAAGKKNQNITGEKDVLAALKLNSGSSKLNITDSPTMADRLRSCSENTRDRKRFALALTKLEIEEDLYGIVGHRPVRRPKKRARIVQMRLDTLFPGLWLKEVTRDMYKVYEAAP